MENTEVIYVLNITLLEVQRGTVLLCKEVQCVERFGLGLGDWRNVGRSRLS